MVVDNKFSASQGIGLQVLSIEINKMTNNCNCTRCNKSIHLMESENPLCSRCQDIIEFGYPSFPAYRLQE